MKSRQARYAEQQYQFCKDNHLCVKCKEPAIEGRLMCEEHRLLNNDYVLARLDRLRQNDLCRMCGQCPPTPDKKFCDNCLNRAKRYNKLNHKKLRDQIFTAYGNKCNCCGETERKFLTIDHINGDGGAHRKAIGAIAVFYDIRRRGFPPGFQILCANCHLAKTVHGVCPHQEEGI